MINKSRIKRQLDEYADIDSDKAMSSIEVLSSTKEIYSEIIEKSGLSPNEIHDDFDQDITINISDSDCLFSAHLTFSCQHEQYRAQFIIPLEVSHSLTCKIFSGKFDRNKFNVTSMVTHKILNSDITKLAEIL